MTTCPVHDVAHNQDGRPRSRFFEVVHRIADRLEPEVQEAFLAAVEAVRDSVDMEELLTAVRANDLARVEAALGVNALSARLAASEGMESIFRRGFGATGQASAQVLTEAGLSMTFDARDPQAIVFARSQSSTLVTRVTSEQRLAIQAIMGRAQAEGLPPRQAARFVHQIVGLRQDWAQAPANLAAELRAGHAAAATSRRLDAATKARIRSRIAAGTVTESFIEDVTETYTHSLRRRRALDIARTETIRSSNAGLDESWRQAQRREVIPPEARRFAVVTPDDRLRDTHAAIPGMNPQGVPIGSPFETPFGALMYPPWEPLCRCSVALIPNPGQSGML